uniref:Granulin precursor n=1 Tax=Buteo japonicus TaxID=224669 RepID=A0A8C0BN27_9AVES
MRGSPYSPKSGDGARVGTGAKGGQEQVGRGHSFSPGGPQAWSWGSLGGQAGLRPPFLPPQAVCCPDHVHCCPQGYTCDPEGGSCLQERGGRLPWVQKTPALTREKDVQCDEETSCPDGNTCCRLSSGSWGCCPLEEVWGYRGVCAQRGTRAGVPCAPWDRQMCPAWSWGSLGGQAGLRPPFLPPQAVCCPDHVHCCPQGYTCDPEGGSCLQERGGRLPWVQKTPALTREKDVQCDEETSCPDGNTCCRLSSGAWGCCPLEEAVCCPDHVHCCPQGYTCDPEGGSCLQERGGRLPWVQKTPVLTRGKDVQCDEETSCPDGNTCCRLSLGTWGCCPLEQAVCCGDHQHCCPRGYTCNVATQSCEKLLAPTPLLPAAPMAVTAVLGGPAALGGVGDAAPSAGTCPRPAGCCSDVPGDPLRVSSPQ